MVEASDDLGPCPLCGRSMIAGDSVNKHHFIPKSRDGRESEYLHRICHSKIHSLFTERELEKDYATAEALLTHPEVQKFVAWVRKKDPEFWDRNDRSNNKRGRPDRKRF